MQRCCVLRSCTAACTNPARAAPGVHKVWVAEMLHAELLGTHGSCGYNPASTGAACMAPTPRCCVHRPLCTNPARASPACMGAACPGPTRTDPACTNPSFGDAVCCMTLHALILHAQPLHAKIFLAHPLHVVGQKAGPGCSVRASSALGIFPFPFSGGKSCSLRAVLAASPAASGKKLQAAE